MAETGVTVSELVPDPIAGLDEAVRKTLSADPKLGAAGLAWRLIGDQAQAELKRLLDIDAFECIAEAWVTARDLHAYADPAKHPRGQTEITHLGAHRLTVSLHPVLEVSVGGLKAPPIRFDLQLVGEFQSAALSILDGAIVAAAPGDCSLTTQLMYGQVALTDPKTLAHAKLPGLKRFDPGLRIP